jgi:outer membrane lipoprotein LolB
VTAFAPSRGLRWLTTCLIAVLLAGCALRPTAPVTVDWAQRSERLLALPAWEAAGRIAVKAARGGGQGDLRWEQQGAESRVRVSGPFGAGAYLIRWDPATLTVSSRNGEYSRAYEGPDSAEQFLTEQLGWSLPASSVRYWLLGMPDPQFVAEQTFAADGRLVAIVQNGWTVTYDRFTEHANLPMPAKMAIESSRARLRLVLDDWKF